jgi:hypothetical protein
MALAKADAAEERERQTAAVALAEAKALAKASEDERKKETEAKTSILDRELKDQKEENTELQKKYTSLTRWFLGIMAFGTLLLLLFIGAMIGVVQSGDVNIPGIGNVQIGAKKAKSSKSKPEPAPVPAPESEEESTEAVE